MSESTRASTTKRRTAAGVKRPAGNEAAPAAVAPGERDGIVCGEVDGVPAFWTPRRRGPAAALLVFAVGQADETLPTRGTTHLVEHLVLHETGQPPHAHNGSTGLVLTDFVMSGSASELVGFCDTVTRSLSDLPTDRLEVERTVLQAEEQSRGWLGSDLWRLRWGPQAHGLVGYNELGVPHVTGAHLHAWARSRFVRGRAALVLNGAPPRGLRLHLQDGEPACAAREATPPPVEQLPASMPASPTEIGLSFLRPRTAAAHAASWLLHERLTRTLRHELGLVYGVVGDSSIVSPDRRHDVMMTRPLESNAEQTGQALLEVLRACRDSGLSEAEQAAWAAHRKEMRKGARGARGTVGWAHYLATATLLGEPLMDFDALEQEREAVTEDSMLGALHDLQDDLLLLLPAEVSGGEIAPAVPRWSASRLQGRVLEPAHGQQERLVVGRDGVTVHVGDDLEGTLTVAYADCRGALAYDDGARALLGRDGFVVRYYPELWRASQPEITRQIDAGLDPALLIPQGERTPFDPPEAPPAPGRRRFDGLLLGLAALCLFGAVAVVLSGPDEETPTWGEVLGDAAVALVFALILAYRPVRDRVRQRRR